MQKKLGLERIKILFANATEYASKNQGISRQQLEVARRIFLKFNIRLSYQYKIFFCKKCKSIILPGIDSRIRVVNLPKLHIKITCLRCGKVYRKIIR